MEAIVQSLHPRYPVLKVPAPARLAAAVAQGLIMPEDQAPGGGNLRLHVLHTYGGGGGPLTIPFIYSVGDSKMQYAAPKPPLPFLEKYLPR